MAVTFTGEDNTCEQSPKIFVSVLEPEKNIHWLYYDFHYLLPIKQYKMEI